jgi:hypothetical protein
MLTKYVTRWNELALAYTMCGRHQESLECYATAASIYEKVQMHCHMQMALGDYLLSKLMLMAIGSHEDGPYPRCSGVAEANAWLFRPDSLSDQAAELEADREMRHSLDLVAKVAT